VRVRSFSAWLLLMLVPLLGGCRATQVAHDGINFRQALEDMYQDQAIDNLIRARRGLGFVQLDYKDLLIQVTDQYFGELSNQQQLTNNEGLGLKAAMGIVPRVFQNMFNIHGSAQRQGQMSFHADPVIDNNDIYRAYLDFAKDPTKLVESDCPPPKGAAHVQRTYCGHYYWVPCEAAAEFQQLVLQSTTMRGAESQPPGFYARRIVDVINAKLVNNRDPDLWTGIVQFDRAVPNGEGRLIITLENGRKVSLRTSRLDETPDDPKKKWVRGEMISYLEVSWRVSRDQVTEHNLKGLKAQVYVNDFPPTERETDVVEEIRHDLNRVRAAVSPILRNPGN
jgi:hypothetical protein